MSAAPNRLWQLRSQELTGSGPAVNASDAYLVRARAFDPGALWRHKWLILVFVLIGALLGAAYAWVRPQEYTATTSIIVTAQSGNADQTVSARGDVSRYQAELMHLQAERARLDAELRGTGEIELPPEAAGSSDQHSSSHQQGVLDRERRLMATRREALEKNIVSLQQEHTLYEGEVESLRKQIELSASERKFLDEELRGIRDLATRKLTTTPRLLDLERTSSVLASRQVELETELLRAQQRINDTEQRTAELRSEYENEVLARRQEVEAKITEATARRDTAKSLTMVSAANERIDPGVLANEIEIIRSDLIGRAVVDQFGLDESNHWVRESLRAAVNLDESAAPAPLDSFRNQLSVARTGAGSRVDIGFTSPEPATSAQLANAVAQLYLASKPAQSAEAAVDGGSDPRILRAATAPTRPDGAGYMGILAASTMLGGLIGLCLAFGLELLSLGRRSNSPAAPQRPEVAEIGRSASTRSM